MTLPVTGPLSLSQINTEIQRPSTQLLSLNDPDVRILAQKPSGQIAFSDLLGKAWLTQPQVVTWIQANRSLVHNWVFGNTGADAQTVTSPYERFVSSSAATLGFSLSGASLQNSTWTTIVITVAAMNPNITGWNVNGGAITPSSNVQTYKAGNGDPFYNSQQIVLYVNANFKSITSVFVSWTRDGGNVGSWAAAAVIPGRWDTRSVQTSIQSSISKSVASNAFMLGSVASDFDWFTFHTGGAPSGTARQQWEARWYNNCGFHFFTNPTGSSQSLQLNGTPTAPINTTVFTGMTAS
jgi:hypothetical protein